MQAAPGLCEFVHATGAAFSPNNDTGSHGAAGVGEH